MSNQFRLYNKNPEQVSREGFVWDGKTAPSSEDIRRYHELGSLARIANALEAMQATLTRMERRMAAAYPLRRGTRK